MMRRHDMATELAQWRRVPVFRVHRQDRSGCLDFGSDRRWRKPFLAAHIFKEALPSAAVVDPVLLQNVHRNRGIRSNLSDCLTLNLHGRFSYLMLERAVLPGC